MALRSILVLVVLLVATSANAQISKIMLPGDDEPGGDEFYLYPGSVFATDDGHVLFTSATGTSGSGHCIFRFESDGSNGEALFCKGGTPPLPGAQTWLQVSSPGAGRRGDLVFKGKYLDTNSVEQSGLFYYSPAGVLSQIPNVIFTNPASSFNTDGALVFSGGSGFYFIGNPPNGVGPLIAAPYDPLPDDPSLIFETIADVALGPNGEIAFTAYSQEPSLQNVNFVAYRLDDGVFTRLATGGTPVGSGIAGNLFNMYPIMFDRVGNLFAVVTLDGGANVIVEWTGSEWEEAVSLGAGESALSLLGAAEAGDLLYSVRKGSDTLLYMRRDGVTSLLAETGTLVPDGAGATFTSSFFAGAGLSATGWAASAQTTSGRGVFASTPPSSLPLLSSFGQALLGLTIVLFGLMSGMARLRRSQAA